MPNKSRLSKWNLQWKLRIFIIVLAMLTSIATEVVEEVELVEKEALVDQLLKVVNWRSGGQGKEIQIVSHHKGFREKPIP